MGKHHRAPEPLFFSKLHLPSREAVAKFGVKAGIVAGLGLIAFLGAKQMYDVSTAPAPDTAGEAFAELDDRFIGMTKGAGMFALATIGSLGFVARLSSIRHRRHEAAYDEVESVDADADLEAETYGRHALREPEEYVEQLPADLDLDAELLAMQAGELEVAAV